MENKSHLFCQLKNSGAKALFIFSIHQSRKGSIIAPAAREYLADTYTDEKPLLPAQSKVSINRVRSCHVGHGAENRGGGG